MSKKSISSRIEMWRMALSTSASAVGWPYFARMSFSSEPAFTPMRIGTPRSFDAFTTVPILSAEPMLPGLSLSASTPLSSAFRASFQSKCMSAITGIFTPALMRLIASAASISGTATLTISHPAASSAFIWATVEATSDVTVFVIDCTVTGAPPPTATPPTNI